MYVDKDTFRQQKIKQHYAQKALQDAQDAEAADPIHRVVSNLAKRLNKELQKRNIKREFRHMKYIGCTRPRLKKHLEAQFTEDMSWDNYGNWEVDHHRGICNWDLHNAEQLMKCFNYSNLRPLWLKDNREKKRYTAE